MAKREKAAKKNKTVEAQPSPMSLELWGIIFVATATLVLISLVSHLLSPADNILGPFFGLGLASGLVRMFGVIPSFLVPAAAFFIGFHLFRGNVVTIRTLAFWALLGSELCVLLAIHNLPGIRERGRMDPNILGNAVTWLLYSVFRGHRFGPYFIFGFATLLTAAVGFRIDLPLLIRRIGGFLAMIGNRVAAFFTTLFRKMRDSWQRSREASAAKAAERSQEREAKKEEKKKDEKSPAPAVAAPDEAAASPEPADEEAKPKGKGAKRKADAEEEDPDGDAKKRLEEELAAFRRRRNEPIKIMTADDAPVPEPEEEPEVFEDEVPSEMLDEEGADEDYYKVPTPEAKPKPPRVIKPYKVPSTDILPDPPEAQNEIDRDAIERNSRTLETTLMNFGVEGKVVNVGPGPVVTRYEIELAPGVKISRIVNLTDDLSMAVGGKRIRIEAPIPGKAAVGVELPNEEMQIVFFKDILCSEVFRSSRMKLPVIIGKTISGVPFVTDITRMPHILIAGQTGSGKSVCINSLICSLLMTRKPDELRLIMIDPKKVEMSYYQGIPHLLSPVVTESKEAVKALQWGVAEMTRRYKLLAKVHARNIDSFNRKMEEKSIKEGLLSEEDNKKLPFIVIIVDELADLMLTASRDVEALIQRIAQLARAVGIHLIVATQRPSVDIITGPIKANLTSRIAFRTIQSTDSRTILGHVGAEKLLGRGDMLFLRNGAPDLERYHGGFISEEDVETVVAAVRSQEADVEKLESFDETPGDSSDALIPGMPDKDSDKDDLFEEAARLVVSTGQGSTSFVQRRLKVGYARAGRLMDELHKAGIVGPQEGSKVREVLVKPDELEGMLTGA
jgi:DNA segregation ATPase FtsK/SpoIIIE-like protein